MKETKFRPIDLRLHAEICVTFRRDSFACSFTDGAQRFDAGAGVGGVNYLRTLGERCAAFPRGNVHVWVDDQIVGQLELRIKPDGSGYANLFYLAPNARGLGWAGSLNRYAVDYFESERATFATLCVAPGNGRAVRFYEKNGWRDTGPRDDAPDVNIYRIDISAA